MHSVIHLLIVSFLEVHGPSSGTADHHLCKHNCAHLHVLILRMLKLLPPNGVVLHTCVCAGVVYQASENIGADLGAGVSVPGSRSEKRAWGETDGCRRAQVALLRRERPDSRQGSDHVSVTSKCWRDQVR